MDTIEIAITLAISLLAGAIAVGILLLLEIKKGREKKLTPEGGGPAPSLLQPPSVAVVETPKIGWGVTYEMDDRILQTSKEAIPKPKGRGGARPGSGRMKGGHNKSTLEKIRREAENKSSVLSVTQSSGHAEESADSKHPLSNAARSNSSSKRTSP